MKSFKKVFMSVLLLVAVFVLASCKKTVDTERLVVNVGPNPDTIDPALNTTVDGATLIIHAFTGLIGYKQDASGALQLVPELATELPTPTTLEDGKVQYVFTLKDNLKWSDGTTLDAYDFEYSWKRAASSALAADYGYMFDVIDGYGTDDPEDLNVKSSYDGKRLTVVLNNVVPYFFELCAFPTYMPVKRALVLADPEGWATKVASYVGNGPYRMKEWTLDSKIVYEKNPYYHNPDAINFPEIEFALSDDDSANLANYKNGTYKFIDSVPNAEIASLKAQYENTEFFVNGQLGTYYVSFNIAGNDLFGDIVTTEENKAKVRKALSLLVDRNYIAETLGQTGQQPADSYVPVGLTEPGSAVEFVDKNGFNGDGTGYYSVAKADYAANCDEAVALLKADGYAYDEQTKKFTNFPSFSYIYNPNTLHAAIGAYLQQAYANFGITLNPEQQEWGTVVNNRKSGTYVAARNGWLGDYNDPISFLDMWTTASGNNDCQFGRGSHADVALYGPDHNQTWAQAYDPLIAQIKSSSDQAVRYQLMHQAENILMETGAIMPIFFYTDPFMLSPEVEGFFASPLGYKFFMYASFKK
jgi:oligopeptide transport system substrate-binding protein